MLRILAVLTISLALAASLGGCSKCGPLWGNPGACHSDAPVR